MKSIFSAALAAAFLFACSFANATQFNVRIVNLTNGIWYTPFLVVAHPDGSSLFSVGQPASASLQAMAEGGDISGLVTDVTAIGATFAENPAAGLLPPAMSANVDLDTDGTANTLLTVVAMLLPTNDAFAGLNSVTIPTVAGTYVFDVPAYDAGTEANDELVVGMAGGAPGVAGIPADPGGFSGTGGAGAAGTDANTNVHIHRNTLGDTDGVAGASDLDSRVHRWLNPVVRVIVTVQ